MTTNGGRRRDTRVVYGVGCVWWGSIYDTGKTPPGPSGYRLPCCPHCGGLLMELPDEAAWWKGVDQFEANGHPGYRRMVEWQRGKCFRTHAEMKAAYVAETGVPAP